MRRGTSGCTTSLGLRTGEPVRSGAAKTISADGGLATARIGERVLGYLGRLARRRHAKAQAARLQGGATSRYTRRSR